MKIFILFIFIMIVPVLLYSQITGISTNGANAVEETISSIMARQILGVQHVKSIEAEKELQYPDRRNLPQNPNSINASSYSSSSNEMNGINQVKATTTLTKGVNFTGATFTTTGANSTPPDNMGYVGPTQFIVVVNGQIISYNKTTGVADGALNTSLDNFFASVKSYTTTCDPRVRYDRLSKRWFFLDIDLPATNNRVLIGVSADSIISASTVMKFFYYQQSGSDFFDYPTLGIDANAIYIGGNLFNSSGTFVGTTAIVVQKSSIMGSGSIVSKAFSVGTSSSGLYTPQGVDNLYDPASTEGYFIGVDAGVYGQLDLIRVSNPGSATPSISTTVTFSVPTTYTPGITNTDGAQYCDSKPGGTGNRLDVDDERLMSAMIRNGHLWTAHHIEVTNAGVGSSSGTRIGARWYDIKNYSTGLTPALNQSGTVYSNSLTNTRDKNYIYPTISVNGQGHALIGFTTVGYYSYANAGYTFRLGSSTAGTMQAPDSNTASSTAYNFTHSIENSTDTHRWGDYSMTECDPSDDMTFWTIQEFCDVANSYGCRVTQLNAPAPPTSITVTPSTLGPGSNLSLVIKGDTTTGLGFYEPGSGFTKHISASIDGSIVVNSITYNSPSTVTLNITTTGGTNGLRTITITNPDGQVMSNSSLFTYNSSLPVELVSFKGEIVKYNQIKLSWSTATEINSNKFNIERSTGNSDWTLIGSVYAAGNSNSTKTYSFNDKSNFQEGLYLYRLKEYDNDGNFKYFNTIEVNYNQLPDQFELAQNYPNPFNPSTTISYSLPYSSMVKLNVFNAIGEKVGQLFNGVQEAGYHNVNFNASSLPSGVYFYSIQTNSVDGTQNFTSTKKMMLLK
ncbi:MAG: T9SS type A sorting domain-containing protein [Ignavibacteriaceae bacterium]|nr:T9SS type A sorting domain-containing protein [Ignavibacteriaceae bacterium]